MDDLMNFEIPQTRSALIKVIGVGGGGSNAVNYMYNLGIKDVNFVVCNTDAQALANSPVPIKIQLGESLTEGRGAGNRPDKGREAAIESLQDVRRVLEDNTKMIFVTAGMGGGTGTGAAPIIAEAAKEMGILTVGIVTIPFRFEGKVRVNQAVEGIAEMEKHVDSLLIINNEKLREMYGDLELSKAFAKADNVLATAAKGIAEIITVHGYINVDFADVETVMKNSGVAIMGSGTAEGAFRAIDAIQAALESPLLNNNQIEGARNILLNITSGTNEVTMDEVGQITDHVQQAVGHSASIIWGTSTNPNLTDEVSVTIIATGFVYENVITQSIEASKKRVTRIELDINGDIVEPVVKADDKPAEKEIELDFDDDESPRIVEFGDMEKEKERRIDILYGTHEKKQPADNTFELNIGADSVNSFATKPSPEKLRDEKLLEELENVPAYKRRGEG
ncbi:MAG: cell division protein FtsZ [Cytophagaceae bacterium]|nr:cell division protein FtsZ [Cytophagaceae bacterium]